MGYVMSKAPPAAKPGRTEEPASGAAAQPDERDATIARLERDLAESREAMAALRADNEALRFKVEILEKSYSKQLADARQRGEVAAKELAGHQTRLKELGTGGEETLRLLEETRAELHRVTAERNLMREDSARPEGRRQPVGRAGAARSDVADTSSTINALIMNAGAQPGRGREPAGDSNLSARVRDEPSSSSEVMVSPDLIFTEKDKDGDDEKNAA